MKAIQPWCFIFIIIIFLVGCSSDHDCEEGEIETPNSIAPIDGGDYIQSLQDCRQPRTQIFSIQGGSGGQIMGNNGTIIVIPPQSIIDSNGEIIDGIVDIRLLEMFNVGELMTCQLSTNTLNASNLIEPTLSEGIFYFDIRFNGEQVGLIQPIPFFIPEEDNTTPLFQFNSPSCPTIDCLVLWEQNFNIEVIPTTIEDPVGNMINGYQSSAFNFGWFSIARFNNNNNERTIVYDKGPTGYSRANSNVFLQLDNPAMAVRLFDQFDQDLDVFTEVDSQIPIGALAHFIFISRQEGIYQYAIDTETIAPSLIGVTRILNEGDESQLINAINNL